MTKIVSNKYLTELLEDAHSRTLELLDGLDDEKLIGPRLPMVNPLLWEIGHVAWFSEQFVLRKLHNFEAIRPELDQIYDSIAIEHSTRWDLPLLNLVDCIAYIEEVKNKLCDRLTGVNATEADSFIYQFATFHQDMHNEAYTYSRQTLSYPTPTFAVSSDLTLTHDDFGPYPGDTEIPGGKFILGASKDVEFLFDNEKWAHEVVTHPFTISKSPVTNEEFAIFVNDNGYKRRDLWPDLGWSWLQEVGAEHPIYWVPDGNNKWLTKRFEKIIKLPPFEPVIHVNWYEASAFCKWADRRLPTELEWEVAASAEPNGSNTTLSDVKRAFPWGNNKDTIGRANLDGRGLGCIDVKAFANGDSAFGCRQMLGNVWEWTNTTFEPYPGFKADAYKEYSEPVFYTRKVLKGGGWATRSRMVNNSHRNFFTHERRDILSGFRTCAVTN